MSFTINEVDFTNCADENTSQNSVKSIKKVISKPENEVKYLFKELIYHQMKAYSERYYIIINRNNQKIIEGNKCKRLLGIKIDNKL